MNHTELIDRLLRELNTRVGIVNIYDKDQQSMMSEILTEWGEFDAKKTIFEFLTEAEPNKNDDRYVSIGFGRFKEKGKEDDEEAPTYKKDDSGNYVKIDKKDSEGGDSKPKVNIFNKDYNKKEEPKEEPKKLTKAEKVQKATKIHKESEQLSKSVYGEDLNSPVLHNSHNSNQLINNGYEEGKYYTAPGNAGSAFNETFSNEVVKIVEKYPDLTEEQLTSILYRRFGDTALARQQSKTSITSPVKKRTGVVPEGVNGDIWKSFTIAARSGMEKSKRANEGKKAAQTQVAFGSTTTTMSFGGTSYNEGKKDTKTGELKPDSKTPDGVVTDLDALKNEIDNATTCYVYDRGTGRVVKIPNEVLKEWVDNSGAGENAADTVVITKDENGNLIFDGWSDKKSLQDLQGNSTLNDDYTKQLKNLDELEKSGKIDKQTSETARNIIDESKRKSEEIEKNYKNAPRKELEYYSKLSGEQREEVLKLIEQEDKRYQADNTKNHVREAMDKFGVKTYGELLDKLIELNNDGKDRTPSNNQMKIVNRTAQLLRDKFKKDGENVPPGLDTRRILSDARKQALDLQRETVDKLNEHSGKTKSGKTKRLGDILGFQETVDFLHIDKIETPTSDNDHKAFLKRNTELIMAGVTVTSENLRKCLGVKDLSDYEDNFEVITQEEFIKAREKDASGNEIISGKTVLIYAVDKDNNKTYVGEKTYRSKDGPTGKTSNTIKWSKEMQTCFDSN